MKIYLDTSVILRYLLNQKPLIEGWGMWDEVWTSELMGLEARRTFDRLRLTGYLDDLGVVAAHEELSHLEESSNIISLSSAIVHRASLAMPTVVKTLDALHLATAMVLKEDRVSDLVFGTQDDQQALAARALGFKVSG